MFDFFTKIKEFFMPSYYFNKTRNEMIFKAWYNNSLSNYYINVIKKNNITTLIFPQISEFTKTIDNLPNDITKLRLLGFKFNQPINYLPNNLIYLELGPKFNQPIDYLPSSLIHLILGFKFNQPIDNLPSSLIHLKLGYKFNQSINDLPNSLEYLELGYRFNQNTNKLPLKLKKMNKKINIFIEHNHPNINIIENDNTIHNFQPHYC
jgi:hypothetical protein